MQTISALLERIQKSLGKSTYIKEAIISVIRDQTRATLSEDNISYKDGLLEISTSSPVLKNEIRMKEETIKNAIRSQTGSVVSRILYK